MSGASKAKRDLKNILQYTRELLSINDRVIFDVTQEQYPYFLEHQVSDLEGVEINVDPDSWLRVKRLRETQPPPSDPVFDGWVSFGRHPSPDAPPKLASERMVALPAAKVDELRANGTIADPADVMRPIESDEAKPAILDVILRADHIPGFKAKWQEYLDGPWTKWAEVERPRRRSINFYNKLYQLYQRITSLGDDNPIEFVFGLGVARWKIQDIRVNSPLLEQLVELELKEDGTIFLHPRSTPLQINLRPFHALEIEGSKVLQRDIGHQLDRMLDDPDIEFSPFKPSTFEFILRTCTARLSATGIYLPDTAEDGATLSRDLPDVTETLRVSDTWVIYVRQRNEDFRRDDIQRLINKVEAAEDEGGLPPPGLCFVREPSNEKTFDGADGLNLLNTSLMPVSARGWNGPSGSPGGSNGTGSKQEETFFFPLPYNDDQIEIIRRLEDKNTYGVLVQGPPGTGKTHTTANIICHYLATNRRVLVTAKTPEALNALQEKIPEGVRDLVIAVIHNDREGSRQLEQAVHILADEAKQINDKVVIQDIVDRQARLSEIRQLIQGIDTELYAYAEKNLKVIPHGDNNLLPMELAQLVADGQARHTWFEDELNLSDKFEPLFEDKDIAEIADLRRQLSTDLIYLVDDLPNPTALPNLARLLAAHGELARINEIDNRSNSGEIPVMSLEEGGVQQARDMRAWLKDFTSIICEVSAENWLLGTYHILLGVKRSAPAEVTALRQSFELWVDLYRRGKDFSLKAVVVGDVPLSDHAFDRAVDDLAVGKQPFGLFGFFKGGLKARIEKVTIEGHSPNDPEEWQIVRLYRDWLRDTNAFLGRWSAVSRVVGAPGLPQDWESGRDEFFHFGRLVEGLWSVLQEVEERRSSLSKMFPYGIDLDAVILHGHCDLVIDALSANLEKAELTDAYAVKAELLAIVKGRNLPWHSAVQQVADNLGVSDVPPSAIADAWNQVVAEAKRLAGLQMTLKRLDDLTAIVAQSGAPKWAQRLRNEVGDTVPIDPATWRETWQWARARGFIRSLSDRERITTLTDQRAAAEAEQKKLFADVVRLRTFLGLKKNMTERVEAALAKFIAAIGHLGKGTGKAAGRHRRIIRESTMEAAAAVPCWILPEWRVSEQLPAELAIFDLVVIDEASQSDITSFPAILRGKKVLIVGDDKQVSPTVIGIEDRKVIQLRTTFLTGLPFADQMDPVTLPRQVHQG